MGQPGSGKSETCRYLAEQYDFSTVLISDLIRDYAASAGIVLKERYDYKIALSRMLRELGGFAIAESILSVPSKRINVDGLRAPACAAQLREYGPIIALHCPAPLRYARTLQRGNPLDKPNFDDFLKDEEQESRSDDPFAQATLTVMESADYSVDASKTLDEVLGDIGAIIKPLLN